MDDTCEEDKDPFSAFDIEHVSKMGDASRELKALALRQRNKYIQAAADGAPKPETRLRASNFRRMNIKFTQAVILHPDSEERDLSTREKKIVSAVFAFRPGEDDEMKETNERRREIIEGF